MYFAAAAVIVILVLMFLYASIKILREYERGIVFTLGRLPAPRGRDSFCSIRSSSRWCASTCAWTSTKCRRRT